MSVSSANSYEPNKTQSNRRFRAPSNPWIPYVGDCKALEKYLKSKEGIGWLIPKYINALLRGISQVILANNPLAGLVILIALFWADVFVGLAAVVAATSAIITAVLMRQDPASIAAGLTTYNAVLVGTVTSSVWTPLYGEPLGIKLWSFIVLGSALSVFVTSAFANILSSMKISLPAITVPFNVVTIILFVSLKPTTTEIHENEDINVNSTEVLDWGKILTGIILSSGQVYGINDVIASILIYVGVMIYSPLLFMMSVVGAIVGTIFGIVFTQAPFEAVYSGLWGYNALLSASSVGGFFIVLTCHSFWNALSNVAFTVLIQQALLVAFRPVNLPVLTLPFILSTLLFLSVTTFGNQLPRISDITFPEMHRYIYRETRKVKADNKRQEKLRVAGDVAEEKELVLTDVKVIDGDQEETTLTKEEEKDDTVKEISTE